MFKYIVLVGILLALDKCHVNHGEGNVFYPANYLDKYKIKTYP